MISSHIPIFYACDDGFAKYTLVSLYSMIKNASREYRYRAHILYTDISEENRCRISRLATDNFEICFEDVSEYLSSISEKLPLRDYYSKTTYYRLFIAEMFPEYEKAIYIDGDTIVQGDISRMYHTNIRDAYLGACHEQVMVQTAEFGEYAERVVGVSRYNFFNAGVLLINCNKFRMKFVLDKFIQYLNTYNFVVTQDEDYLNLICKDHVYWLDGRWNTEVFGNIEHSVEEAYVVHYIMVNKPWHYADCRFGDVFWAYASNTEVYEELLAVLDNYSTEEKEKDALSAQRLLSLAIEETEREDNFLNRLNRSRRADDRVDIVKKIERFEKEGRFWEDVEADPESKVLMPCDIDYLNKGMGDRIKTAIAFSIARQFVNGLIEEKKLMIREIRGIENFNCLDSGAVITCNHFNAFDSFAIQLAYEASEQGSRRFYRVIREGNYTSFPGFYGFLMRHCNTLPLSSNRDTLKKFTEAVDTLLREGHFVLVYPEQSMWWNYRKPKPLRSGAFMFAAKSGVPVLPCFITMRDSDVLGNDGYFVQEYTIHISPPIYPEDGLSYRKNMEKMMDKNYSLWREIYEREYGMPLVYTTEKQKTES